MGTFRQHVGVRNGVDGETRTVLALVDTGAAYTVLPSSLLEAVLGGIPARIETFTLADGRTVSLPVGEARLQVEGREATSPVVFGPEGKYLLGATTLQTLGLIADTTNHRLISAPELTI